ncbi:type VI secretion protein ImpA [Rhodoferax koreense]|uniref:Type VI secretion protein ImpA n=1 Tax=Rhodoferax koreensis TaxID=1842727 RepID=A0A1P8JSS2_9BURK|nr:type VI secretion system Vgr family protein [Rhodoferax koreense]APW36799.1 type VI secretion protein ImpA [Rhodoferax koreense]
MPLTSHSLTVESEVIPVVNGQPALEPVRLSGHEGVNSLFAYELLLKTPDSLNLGASEAADFDLDAFIGREIRCRIQLDGAGAFLPGAVGDAADHVGAGAREINALVADAAFWGEEGRFSQYRLTLRPWLHLATLNTDCRIFQNQTVVELLDTLLADYPFPVDKRLIDTYPVRDYQTQFNESDFAFFSRLCEEWGINYFFEHDNGRHRLVLIDNMGAHLKNPSAAYQAVDYHPPGWKTDAEYIHSFLPQHRLTSGRYSTRDYDYTRPRADLSASRKDPRPTGQNDAEVYQWHDGVAGSHYAQPKAGTAEANDPQAEARQFALLRMQALRSHGARAQGSGNLRGMVPGCSFTLQNHPRHQANGDYLVLDTRFLIEDVGQASQVKDAAALRKQAWRVEVDFTAHPMAETLRPAPTQAKPRSAGPQSALVVGPAGENLWTDQLGRIKVQFPWDREGQKNQHSSCWVRVSSPWAGNQLGGVQLPRIGQEVLIDFIGGDMDLPVCTGRVHNQVNLPPWSLPEQAALSGWRSRELNPEGGNSAAGRSNHLLLDDTAGKIQAQLKSDHRHSQLSLGHITRIEDHAGRKDARGEGFELATEAHGVIRAGEGMLITTEARPRAAGHAKAMEETVARLTEGRDQHASLGSAALEAKAQDTGDQDRVAQALTAQNESIRGTATGREGHFPELDEPHLVVASAAGIETSSAQSTHLQAGEHVALTSGAHTSLTARQSILASAKQAIRLFAYNAGMRLVAFCGNIEIKALKNSIAILAQLNITQTADSINITARKELMLNGAGSYFKLNAGGIEGGTQGQHRVFAANHAWVGPKNAPTMPLTGDSSLEEGPSARSFVLRSHAENGRPMAMEPYTLYRDGAEIGKGVTDAQGRVLIDDHRPGTSAYRIKLTNGNTFDLPVTAQLQGVDQHLSAKGYRAAQGDASDRRHHYQQGQGGPDET